MSSSEILQATYENNGEFFNSPVGLHLALMPTTIEGLNLEVRKGKIGSPRLYSAKPKIDLNAPTCLINSDMQRLKTYIEYLEKYDEKHSKELYARFMISEGATRIDFAGMLSELKKFDCTSFKPSAHNVRVLGFWLWEQVDLLKKFKTLSEAIGELKSDIHCPVKLHAKMGIGTRDNLQNLYQSTKECIEKAEVLAMN